MRITIVGKDCVNIEMNHGEHESLTRVLGIPLIENGECLVEPYYAVDRLEHVIDWIEDAMALRRLARRYLP